MEIVKDELIRGLSIVTTMAENFEAMKMNGVEDRHDLTIVLKNIIGNNSSFIGAWTVWEPNALDGKDGEYINADYHDETGRFIPYWNKGGGSLKLDKVGATYLEEGETGHWYFTSRDSGRVYISEPSIYTM